ERVTRILRLLGLPIGIAVVAWLVMQADPAALFGMFPRIGWGFVAILLARAATVVIDCGAWQCLLPRRGRPSFAVMLPLRWIAESINTTLPAAQIGGEVVRARLLQRRLDAPARGAASLQALGAALTLLAESRPALAWSLSLHVISWLGHAGEVWLTLWLMGASTGVGEALILESLSLAARSAAFLIPSGWGAQEAAL